MQNLSINMQAFIHALLIVIGLIGYIALAFVIIPMFPYSALLFSAFPFVLVITLEGMKN